jgi:hypothetical protein
MSSIAKQEWRDYICQSNAGGRLLSTIGASVSLAPSAAFESGELARILELFRRGKSDVRIIASVVDLLNPVYLDYFARDIQNLLDHLSSETVKDEVIVGPALRGNPRWDRTLLARRTGMLPVGRFISRLPRRSFARPENALLKWLVEDILRELHHLERQVGVEGLPTALRALYSSVDAVSRAYGLSEIDSPNRLLPDMIFGAKRGRRREYRAAADMAIRRNELNHEVSNGKWKALLSLLASGWLEPIDVDDLFELYALTHCLESLVGDLGYGFPTELGLAIRNRRYVARFVASSGATVEVFFNQSPLVSLGVHGRYGSIINAHHGVGGASRRPDITIVSQPVSGKRRVTFVEVKKTHSKDYLSESIYKAFGYIHDYGCLWDNDDLGPKVILFVPAEVELRSATIPDVAFVSSQNPSEMSRVLSAALKLT